MTGPGMPPRTRPVLPLEGERRVALALLAQPLVVGLFGFAIFPLVDYTGQFVSGGRAVNLIDGGLAFGLGVGIAGALTMVFGAFPALMWRLRRGPLTRGQVLLCGVALGNLPGAVIVATVTARQIADGRFPYLTDATGGAAGALRAVAIGALIGAFGALVFWVAAGRYVGAAAPRSIR